MVPHGFTESALQHDTLKHVGGRLPGFKLVIKAWKWGRLFVLSARVHMSYSRQANCTMRKSEIKNKVVLWVLSKGRKTARAKKKKDAIKSYVVFTGTRCMWTGWKPTSPSGLRCSITSKSNTPPDWPGARLWVSKGRRRREEKKIKKEISATWNIKSSSQVIKCNLTHELTHLP